MNTTGGSPPLVDTARVPTTGSGPPFHSGGTTMTGMDMGGGRPPVLGLKTTLPRAVPMKTPTTFVRPRPRVMTTRTFPPGPMDVPALLRGSSTPTSAVHTGKYPCHLLML